MKTLQIRIVLDHDKTEEEWNDFLAEWCAPVGAILGIEFDFTCVERPKDMPLSEGFIAFEVIDGKVTLSDVKAMIFLCIHIRQQPYIKKLDLVERDIAL